MLVGGATKNKQITNFNDIETSLQTLSFFAIILKLDNKTMAVENAKEAVLSFREDVQLAVISPNWMDLFLLGALFLSCKMDFTLST